MPIIDEYKLFHLHVPKTGGSSIIKYFNIWEKEEAYHIFQHQVIDGIWYTPQHFTWSILEKNFPNKWKEYKKFIVVRNPYTRAVSSYIDKMKHFCPYGFKIYNLNTEHFCQWIDKTTKLMNTDHALPQVRYIGPFFTDYVIKFENLETGFNYMIKDLGIDTGNKLEVYNSADQPVSTEELADQMDSQSIDIINNVYQKDFDFFGYKQK